MSPQFVILAVSLLVIAASIGLGLMFAKAQQEPDSSSAKFFNLLFVLDLLLALVGAIFLLCRWLR